MTIRPVSSDPNPAPVEPRLDHLVYATPDLAGTVAEFRAATGLDPEPGGRHVGRGTRNLLVGLGPSSYLEIIGPDVDLPPEPGQQMPFGIADLDRPRLITWAVHPVNIESAVAASAAAGADLGAIAAMGRDRPDGVRLSWRLATTYPLPFGGVTPFLIDWGTSPHPASADLPAGRLLSLRGTHPDPAGVTSVLDAIQVHLPVVLGPAALVAEIDTPSGTVELG